MFKVLKWIYELGVKNERQRVRLLFEAEKRSAEKEVSKFYNINSNKITPDLEREMWVANGLLATLNRILEPQLKREYTSSKLDED